MKKPVSEPTFLEGILGYFRTVWLGVRSLVGAVGTALPYLLSVRSGDLRKEVTEQYPDPVSARTADDLPPRTRGLLFNKIDRCTGCGDCVEVCPVACIHLEVEESSDTAKPWVSIFDIDFARCTFCGLCVESCNPMSLQHTRQYEGAVLEPGELVASFGRGRLTPEQRSKWVPTSASSEGFGLGEGDHP